MLLRLIDSLDSYSQLMHVPVLLCAPQSTVQNHHQSLSFTLQQMNTENNMTTIRFWSSQCSFLIGLFHLSFCASWRHQVPVFLCPCPSLPRRPAAGYVDKQLDARATRVCVLKAQARPALPAVAGTSRGAEPGKSATGCPPNLFLPYLLLARVIDTAGHSFCPAAVIGHLSSTNVLTLQCRTAHVCQSYPTPCAPPQHA